MIEPSFQEIVQTFELMPHPEGGFYRETYRSSEKISQASLPARFGGERDFSTAIYYLLPQGKRSSLHKIQSDEVWHFYLGGPLMLVGIDLEGRPYSVTLGREIQDGQKLQHVVPAGHWFGATPAPWTEYSLVGCTVAPGFDFSDFGLGNREELLAKYPLAGPIIRQFT